MGPLMVKRSLGGQVTSPHLHATTTVLQRGPRYHMQFTINDLKQ